MQIWWQRNSPSYPRKKHVLVNTLPNFDSCLTFNFLNTKLFKSRVKWHFICGWLFTLSLIFNAIWNLMPLEWITNKDYLGAFQPSIYAGPAKMLPHGVNCHSHHFIQFVLNSLAQPLPHKHRLNVVSPAPRQATEYVSARKYFFKFI